MPQPLISLTGRQFGWYTVLSCVGCWPRIGRKWLCVCRCGVKKEVWQYHLRTGSTKSCGCWRRACATRLKRKLIPTGKKFGWLTVIEMVDKKDKGGRVLWLCRCRCGIVRQFRGSRLRNGRVKSCGCLGPSLSRKRIKHGFAKQQTVSFYNILYRYAYVRGIPFDLSNFHRRFEQWQRVEQFKQVLNATQTRMQVHTQI